MGLDLFGNTITSNANKMGVLRFPNPSSDTPKFIDVFSTLFRELSGKEGFSHDNSRDAIIKHGLVSSSGAIGREAVKRSVRDDRSLDPLYNQLKMYSELYRMLGWLRPGTMNTNFNFTELSEYVALSADNLKLRIFELCLLSIVFPNPLVENKSGNSIRPFPLILRLARLLDNCIFRDEIIIAVFTLTNDKRGNVLNELVRKIKEVRKSTKQLFAAKSKLSTASGIAEPTLENYTRFPLGSLKGTGWFESNSIRGIYEKPLIGYELQRRGILLLEQIENLVDVRYNEIAEFKLEERGAFALGTHYIFLQRCGFDISAYKEVLEELKNLSRGILEKLGVSDFKQTLYSPIQQSTQRDINFANELEKRLFP